MSRQQLQELAGALQRWETDIPVRAVTFHNIRGQLLNQVNEHLGNRLAQLLPGWQRQTDELIGKGRQLGELAQALRALMAECDVLRDQVLALISRASQCPDEGFAKAARSRATDAEELLSFIGSNVETPAGSTPGWEQLRDLRIKLDSDTQAMPLINEALHLYKRWSSQNGPYSAPLGADIDRWRREFRAGAATPEWIARLRQVLESYRRKAAELGLSSTQKVPVPGLVPAPPLNVPPYVVPSPDPQRRETVMEHRPAPVVLEPPKPEPKPEPPKADPPYVFAPATTPPPPIAPPPQPKPTPPPPPPPTTAPPPPPPPPPTPRPKVVPVQPPKLTLRQIEEILSECRSWALPLNGGIEVVQPLMDRRWHLEQGHADAQAINTLADDATQLRSQLRQAAFEDRGLKLKTLRKRLNAYTELCESNIDLERNVAKAEKFPVDSPDDYAKFRDAFKDADEYLRAIATIDQDRLTAGLRTRIAAVKGQLDAVRLLKRFRVADKQLQDLEKQIPAAPVLALPAMEAFESMELCTEIEDKLGTIESLSEEGRKKAEDTFGRIRVRTEEWKDTTRLLAAPDPALIASLESALSQVDVWMAATFLDDINDQIEPVKKLLDSLEAESRAIAHAQLTASIKEIAFIQAELVDSGHKVPRVFPRPEKLPDEPIPIRLMLEQVASHLKMLAVEVDVAAKNKREEVAQFYQKLTQLTWRTKSTEPTTAAELKSEYEHLPPPATPETVEVLQLLRAWVKGCDGLFYSLEEDQRDFETRFSELHHRLTLARKQRRDAYHPALYKRASDLLFALDPLPCTFMRARTQMREVERLLTAIEKDAVHKIADETARLRHTLERKLAASRDNAFRDRALPLLAEIDKLDRTQVPSPDLLRRLRLLTR